MGASSRQAEEIFAELVEIEDATLREEELFRRCKEDESLRGNVQSLLEALKKSGSFFAENNLPGVEGGSEAGFIAEPGDRIKNYRLLEVLGEGTFGQVWRAEQEKPIRREVALKLIKQGMDTREVVLRFEAEGQALALMEHPNIARVFDGGASHRGRPFFVMDMVRGLPLTQYCDQERLNVTKRLKLFISVCDGIHHAHLKGIIHRDIKPSNILVALRDGKAVPTIIDFGIAKAIQRRLTDGTLHTAFHQLLGTPAYMSPEQAGVNNHDVDTRSDIYSLGVLLYELLTGKTPLEPSFLISHGYDAMRQFIREIEPPMPSIRLRQVLPGELAKIEEARTCESGKLIGLLRGEIDWIVMKCLQKDPHRRYSAVSALATDIQNYLKCEPITAGPSSRFYRLGKFARRHRLAMISGSVGVLLLLLATIVSTRQAVLARQAQAEQREHLRGAFLAQARSQHTSHRAGQRFGTLEAVKRAAEIRPGLDVRNEALAGLAMSDVRLRRSINLNASRSSFLRFDCALNRYVLSLAPGNLTIRNLSAGTEIISLLRSGAELRWVGMFSEDGRLLPAGYADKTFRIWDTHRGETVREGLAPTSAAALSGDGRWFVSSSGDAGLLCYDLFTKKPPTHIELNVPHQSLVFDSAGTLLACVRRNGTAIDFLDIKSETIVATVTSPTSVLCLAWSPDGKLLAGGCKDQHVRLWDVPQCTLRATLGGLGDNLSALCFNHRGNLLASACWDQTIRLWDPYDGREIVSYPGNSSRLLFSPDDETLASYSGTSQISLLEISQAREYRRLHLKDPGVRGGTVEFTPDGSTIAATTDIGIRFCEVGSEKEVAWVHPKGRCDSVVFDRERRRLITSERDIGVCARHMVSQEGSILKFSAAVCLFAAPDLRQVGLSADGSHLALADHAHAQSVIIDLADSSRKVFLKEDPEVDYIALSPNARWAATGSFKSEAVKVWDAGSGRLLRTLTLPEHGRVAFSPDGRWLATSSSEYQFWEVGTWKQGPKRAGDPTVHVSCLAFSPDGLMVATGQGSKIELLGLPSGSLLGILDPPDGNVISDLRFSPDGHHLAVLERNQEIQLWDLRLIRRQLSAMHLAWKLTE